MLLTFFFGFNFQGLYTDSILKYVVAPGLQVHKHPGAKVRDIIRGEENRITIVHKVTTSIPL